MICKICKKDEIEWIGTYCQLCWEAHTAAEFWKMIEGQGNAKTMQ